jgi:phosphatidate cytidylyltransferase
MSDPVSRRTNPAPAGAPPASAPPAKPAPTKSKWADLGIRLVSGFALIGGQLLFLAVGAPCVNLEIIMIAFGCYRECMHITLSQSDESTLSLFLKAFPWLWFSLFVYLLKGLWFFELIDAPPFLSHYHYFLCYAIAALLIVVFVLNLNPTNMKYAFRRLIPMVFGTICVIIPSICFALLSEVSVFWFYTAASMIVQNDSAAYFFGRNFGKHRLIALSPNKTVEGFVGALLWCLFAGYFQPLLFVKWPFSYCSNVRPFDFRLECPRPAYWTKTDFVVFGHTLWKHYPVQLHSLVIGLFAGLIAPFGGFLASGLKRCVDLKDFGNAIPGHGGVLDRMDCQLVMGSFAFLYLKTFVLR